MLVVKGLFLGAALWVIYSVVYLYYVMYRGLRENPAGLTPAALPLFDWRYWAGAVGMLLIGCAIVWYWSSGASMWIINGHLFSTGLIVKGILLGAGLFLVCGIVYFVLLFRSKVPGYSPVGAVSVDARTFTALTVNPLFWTAFLVCVGIGCAIVWYWPRARH